jgi:hypothetical protein
MIHCFIRLKQSELWPHTIVININIALIFSNRLRAMIGHLTREKKCLSYSKNIILLKSNDPTYGFECLLKCSCRDYKS